MGHTLQRFAKCYFFQFLLEARFHYRLCIEPVVSIINNLLVNTTSNKFRTISTLINKIGVARVQMSNSMEISIMTFATVKINFSISVHLWILGKISSVVFSAVADEMAVAVLAGKVEQSI